MRAYNQSMVITIGQASLETERGDISQAKVDAVVNAANNHLWMGSGVAGALKRAGGLAIERAAVAKGPVQVGEAVITNGGALAPTDLIHAPVVGHELLSQQIKSRPRSKNVLLLARALGTGLDT